MARLALLACVVFSVVMCTKAARILAVFPTPSISHQVVFRPLTQELAKRGHEVVIITPDPAFPKGRTPSNLTEIDLHDVSYRSWPKFVQAMMKVPNDISQWKVAGRLLYQIFEQQVNSEDFQALLNDKQQQFDLLLIEECMKPALALSHFYKVPVIQVSSLGATESYHTMGAPMHPLLYPPLITRRLYNLTFWEKLTGLYDLILLAKIAFDFKSDEDKIMQRMFGPDVPSLDVLANNVDMVFLNVHPIWDSNRPVPPGIVYMGGLHTSTKPVRELPQDLKHYLDSSKHGVIYVSFGTNVQSSLLPPEKTQMLINVFSQLPYEILWKWDNNELPGRSKNIRISKWFPQSDLLRHPKIKLFITQGGLQSTDEAIAAGVPLIGIPMFADQWYNVEKYVHHGIGMRLDMESLTEEKLRNSINTTIGDVSYRRNVIKLHTLMNNQPQRPLERVVWWTEHVLRHGGGRHLRTPAADISWADYFMLDVVVPVLLVLFTLIFLASISLHYVLCFVLNRRNHKIINYFITECSHHTKIGALAIAGYLLFSYGNPNSAALELLSTKIGTFFVKILN